MGQATCNMGGGIERNTARANAGCPKCYKYLRILKQLAVINPKIIYTNLKIIYM
jgi:hypothetical protein